MIPGGTLSPWPTHVDGFENFLTAYVLPKKVIQHSSNLALDQLVSVTQYHTGAIGPPLAVGRMAVSSDTLRSADKTDVKGKAVHILHAWKDYLWEMGPSKRADPPAPVEIKSPDVETTVGDEAGSRGGSTGSAAASPSPSADATSAQVEEGQVSSEAQASTEELTETKVEALTSEGLYLPRYVGYR